LEINQLFLQAFAVKGNHPDHAKSRPIRAIHCVARQSARQSNFHTFIPVVNDQQEPRLDISPIVNNLQTIS